MANPPIGPYPHPPPDVKLRPWNPVAPVAAARVIALIADRLPDTAIEHVGSSAVPGCDGKGSLDFAIPYHDTEHLRAINEALFALGFQRQRRRDPFPETRPMRTGAFDHGGETFLLHLHVVPAGSTELAEVVDFRDRLRATPVRSRSTSPQSAPSSLPASETALTMPRPKASSSSVSALARRAITDTDSTGIQEAAAALRNFTDRRRAFSTVR